MWRAISAVNLPKVEAFDFDELQHRAEAQIERVEAERIRAARQAFANPVDQN
jgi:hypothetical protein